MDNEFDISELAKREENFYGGRIPSTDEGKKYYAELQELIEQVKDEIGKLDETDDKGNILQLIFSHIYDFVIEYNQKEQKDYYSIFSKDEPIYNDAFEACLFISLCMFLHDSKRIDGMTQQDFVYKYDPRGFNEKESPNYYDKENLNYHYDEALDTGNKLRKYRSRLFSFRPVHNTSEWSSIRKASEHEWKLYYNLKKADKKIQKTYKDIRNLNNEIEGALNSPEESVFIEELKSAYDKFSCKLKKIKYEDYLQLIKFFLNHICEDKTYYGINLYRLEKELQPFKITNEVNRLLACENGYEKDVALKKFLLLQSIPFPKVYDYIYTQTDESNIIFVPSLFCSFTDQLVQSSRLIIDKFVEDGFWGEDWVDFLLKTVNDLAPSVLYDPESIDCIVTPEFQETFMNYLTYPILIMVNEKIKSLKSPQ